jgi:hypothetical protein
MQKNANILTTSHLDSHDTVRYYTNCTTFRIALHDLLYSSKITAQYFDEKKLFFSGKVSIVLLFWISGLRRLCSIESQVRVFQMRDIIDKEEVHSFNVLKNILIILTKLVSQLLCFCRHCITLCIFSHLVFVGLGFYSSPLSANTLLGINSLPSLSFYFISV